MSAHSQPFSVETLIDILIADPDRFETTKYVEMGVPMFLIGEDATAQVASDPAAGASSNLGNHLADLATTLTSRKPAIDVDDVARLLEVLADRHFLSQDAEPREVEARAMSPLLLPPSAPPVLAELIDGLAHSRGVRMVNFHATPRYREAEFRQQIEAFAAAFEPVTPANFAAALEGRWDHARPALLPALFEGYRDNLDVLLPILEEFGFTAWFFVPSGFLNVPAHEQRAYAAGHQLYVPEQDEYPDDRIALTWDEVRHIAGRGHVFACHTRTHNEVTPETPRAVLENEIAAAKAELEAELGAKVEIFCWLEGAELGVNPEADAMLRDVGFRYLFSNFKVQKLQ